MEICQLLSKVFLLCENHLPTDSWRLISWLNATDILSRAGGYAWREWRIPVRMIGFIGTLVTISLNHIQYSDIADLHTLRFTVAHALGLSVFTSRLLATDLNRETSTSKHYEVLLPFLVQSLWKSTAVYHCHLKTEICSLCNYRHKPPHRPQRKQPILL
jgi:hypothetical protein